MEIVRSDSGLLIAAESADADGVGALLREYDPDLRLVPRYNAERDCVVWAVYSYNGPNHPSGFVCFWQTRDGVPLPLSSNLLELVKQLDKNTAGSAPDPDAENRRLRERRAKDRARDYQAIIDEWVMPHGRPVLPRSQSLRRARDKQRARGKKV